MRFTRFLKGEIGPPPTVIYSNSGLSGTQYERMVIYILLREEMGDGEMEHCSTIYYIHWHS